MMKYEVIDTQRAGDGPTARLFKRFIELTKAGPLWEQGGSGTGDSRRWPSAPTKILPKAPRQRPELTSPVFRGILI
jgi:hypothetical protein